MDFVVAPNLVDFGTVDQGIRQHSVVPEVVPIEDSIQIADNVTAGCAGGARARVQSPVDDLPGI